MYLSAEQNRIDMIWNIFDCLFSPSGWVSFF